MSTAGAAVARAMEKAGRAVDQTSARVKRLLSSMGSLLGSVKRAVFSVEGLIAGVGVGALAGSFLNVSREVEHYETRLRTMLGGQEQASRAMANFEAVARKVPYGLGEVIEAGVQLEAFGANHEQWIEPLADVAAMMGEDIPAAAYALGRAYSGGAGAADIFREKGILEIIKEFARLKYNVEDITKLTLPQFRQVMLEAFTDPNGKFAGSAQALAGTWDGLMSMLGDAWFRFRRMTMESGLFDYLKDQLRGLLAWFEQAERSGKLREWAVQLGDAVQSAFESIRDWLSRAGDWWTEHGETVKSALSGILTAIEWVVSAIGNLTENLRDASRAAARITPDVSGAVKYLQDRYVGQAWWLAAGATTPEKMAALLKKGRADRGGADPRHGAAVSSLQGFLQTYYPELLAVGWDQSTRQLMEAGPTATEAEVYQLQALMGQIKLSDEVKKRLGMKPATTRGKGLAVGAAAEDAGALRKLDQEYALLSAFTDHERQLLQLRQQVEEHQKGTQARIKAERNYALQKKQLEEKQAGETYKARQDLELRLAQLRGDSQRVQQIEHERFMEQWTGQGLEAHEAEMLWMAEREEENKSSLQRMLESWTDTSSLWAETTVNMLRSVQSGFQSFFEQIFDDGANAFQALGQAAKTILFSALSQIATAYAMQGLGNLLLPIFGSAGLDTSGGLLSGLSTAGSAYSLYDTASGISTFGEYGGMGSGLFTWSASSAAPAGVSPMAWHAGGANMAATGLSTAGAALSGVGGAFAGWETAKMLYGDGTGSQVGGAVGGAAGGWGGATLGLAVGGPIGAGVGALLGGLLGGAGGGGLGSLFDGDEPEPWEEPGNYLAHWQRMGYELDRLESDLDSAGLSAEGFNERLADMAPLAAGAGDYLAGYGEVLGGALEHINSLTAGTEEWQEAVENLTMAQIIQAGVASDMAAGMSKLDANSKALDATIEALLSTESLSQASQDELVDLLLSQSGTVADLTAKYERLQEIKEKLREAHKLERGEVEALVAEGRTLSDALGLQQGGINNLNNAIERLGSSIDRLAYSMRSLPSSSPWASWGDMPGLTGLDTSGSAAGLEGWGGVYHQGGLVDAALSAGLITAHGGRFLDDDELLVKARRGEWVIQDQAVRFYGPDFFARLNDMSVPVRAAQPSAPAATAPAPGGLEVTIHQQIVLESGAGEADAAGILAAAKAGAMQALAEAQQRGVVLSTPMKVEQRL